MKTYKNLNKEICCLENLFLAYKKARKGKTKKDYVLRFEENLVENLMKLQEELIKKTYKPRPLKRFIIRDPKTRKICKSEFRDRIIHHALCNIIEPVFERIFIYDSYASRKNKGQHKALERFDYFKRKVSRNGKKLKGIKDNNYICGYVLKTDITKYFDTVDNEILINIIKEKVRDKDVIWLIRQILDNHLDRVKNKGMPLGNHTSQFFANVYLNELDYFIKHKLKARYYIRYVDDLVILHNSKQQLEKWKRKINNFLEKELRLELHKDKSKIIPLHKGLLLLGFRNFYYFRLLRKSNVTQIRRNIKEWRRLYKEKMLSHEKLIARLEGWLAHARYGNTYKLRKKVVKQFNKISI